MNEPEFEPRRQQLLVEDMIVVLQNIRHLAAYRTIAATVSEDLIRKALSEIQHDEASEIGDPIADIQVLTPANGGIVGARALNVVLQQRLNPSAAPQLQRFGLDVCAG